MRPLKGAVPHCRARARPSQLRAGVPGEFVQVPSVQSGCFQPISSSHQQQLPTSGDSIGQEPVQRQQEPGGSEPQACSLCGKGEARLLGKPRLNRELEPANAPCSLRHKSCPAALPNHSQQLCARSQNCRVLKGCKDFLSVQSQKQNTQHWQPPDEFYQETTTFPQPLLPCASLCCPISRWEGQQAPANTPGLWAPRPRARPRAHRTLWPGSACSDFL